MFNTLMKRSVSNENEDEDEEEALLLLALVEEEEEEEGLRRSSLSEDLVSTSS